MEERVFWNDLTDEEKEQATNTYMFIRNDTRDDDDEECTHNDASELVKECTLYRDKNTGYIAVNV